MIDWGSDIYFEEDCSFINNLKICSSFVLPTIGIFMSSVEGNHPLFAALCVPGYIYETLPYKKDKRKKQIPDVSDKIVFYSNKMLKL